MTDRIQKRETLGGCRLKREIGRGGMGVVYEAVEESTGDTVAVKVLSAFRALDADKVRRFLEEARTAVKLDHPNIVSIHRVGSEDGNYYIVMDYIDGKPLDAYWKEELIDFRASAEVVLTCAEALEHAHRAGVVHLDVKPSNILLDAKTQRAFLADFGLAHAGGGRTGEGAIAGTPRYMSPEQARGDRNVDLRSDIFSLGVTLYNLLTHAHPFEGEDVHIILENVISCRFPRPRDLNPGIPGALEAIVLKALEKNPERRYLSAVEMANDLRSFLDGESVTASVPLLKRRGFRVVRRRTFWYVLGLGVLASLALLRFAGPPHLWIWPDSESEEAAPDPSQARAFLDRGDGFFQTGDFPNARAWYDRALALNPCDKITLVKRGQILAFSKEYDRALTDFDEALRIDPDFVPGRRERSEAYMETGRLAAARADLDRALRVLGDRRAKAPRDEGLRRIESELLASLGRLHFLGKNIDKALAVLARAIELDGANARAHLYAGLSLLKRKQFKKACDEVQLAMRGGPRDYAVLAEIDKLKNEIKIAGLKGQFHRLQAVVHFDRGLFAKAAAFASKALQTNADDAHALFLRGKAFFQLGRYEKAVADFNRVLVIDESDVSALLERARALRYLGSHRRAAQDGRRAVKLAPDSVPAHREIGLALARLGSIDEAQKHLLIAAEALEDDLEPARVLMEIFARRENHPQALWAAARVVARHPRDRRARLVRARALKSEKKYSEALAELAYLRSDSGNEVKLLEARLLLCLQRPRESLARLGGLVNPAGREIAERDRLEADVFLKLGHEREYLAALTRYLKAAPADWKARMERGGRFGAMGRNEEARDDFTRVLETRPKLREGHISLARVLLALGDTKNALLSVDEVLGLRLDPKGLLLRGRVRMAGKDPAGAVKDFIRARTLCREGDKELRGRISFHETVALAGLGQAREALRCADETLLNDGERKDVSRYRFDLLLDAGPDARARLALERYGKVFGEDGFTDYARARLLAGQGKCNQALTTLGTLKSIDSVEAFRIPGLRGECLYRLGKYRQALAYLKQALSFASDRGQLWFLLGRTYESQDQRLKALACYDKALARLFESAKVHLARGLLLERMKGKEARAIADISEAIRLRPKDASPYVWRARLRRRTGDRKGARDDLGCALKIDPANTSTRQALVDLEEESGRLEEALAGMEEIIRRNGRTPETSCRRARLLLALRRFVDCLDVSGKILAEKKAARVTRGKVQILRAEALLALRRWPEAIEESERARRQHPALAVTAAVLRGEAYLGRGKDSHGVGEPDEDYIRAYHELNGIHTRAVEGEFPPGKSARIHAAMGHYQWIAEKDHAQALAQYRRAAALAPRWSEPYRRIGAMAAGGLWPGGVDVSLTALDRARAMGHRDRAGVAFDRGRLLKQKGRYAEAVEEFRRALSVRPGWPEARKLLKVCQAMLR